MIDDRDKKIRERAYRIWQDEGEPHGKDVEHWHRARAEVEPTSEAEATPDAARADAIPPEVAPARPEPQKRKTGRAKSSPAPRRRRQGGAESAGVTTSKSSNEDGGG